MSRTEADFREIWQGPQTSCKCKATADTTYEVVPPTLRRRLGVLHMFWGAGPERSQGGGVQLSGGSRVWGGIQFDWGARGSATAFNSVGFWLRPMSVHRYIHACIVQKCACLHTVSYSVHAYIHTSRMHACKHTHIHTCVTGQGSGVQLSGGEPAERFAGGGIAQRGAGGGGPTAAAPAGPHGRALHILPVKHLRQRHVGAN